MDYPKKGTVLGRALVGQEGKSASGVPAERTPWRTNVGERGVAPRVTGGEEQRLDPARCCSELRGAQREHISSIL